ncbi:MAG: class I SAM-dependent methyltransferase [Candidatus Omnitrophota bacterium]
MDRETLRTKDWLDKRFTLGVKEGKYFAHQPIYGYKKGFTEGRDIIRYARILSILQKLSNLQFDNFVDIGGAEGYAANLVKKIFNVDSYTSDLSFEANLRARELFGIDSVGLDVCNLPFKDESFDVVLCSEVIEHVSKPAQTLYELKRIARKALLITTEAICYSKGERKLRMLLVNLKEPHADRNWYIADDFMEILGKEICLENTIADTDFTDKKNPSITEVKNILNKTSRTSSFSQKGLGASISLIKDRSSIRKAPSTDSYKLVDLLLNSVVNLEYSPKKTNNEFSDKLTEFLMCPKCGKSIKKIKSEYFACVACEARYKIEKGIPLLYTHEEDIQFLSKKWENIYRKHFNDYGRIMRLVRLFQHTRIRQNIFIRILATRLLKINKCLNNCKTVLNNGTLKDLIFYILQRIYRKGKKEIKRFVPSL